MRRDLFGLLLLCLFACKKDKFAPNIPTTQKSQSSQSTPQTPNRFDSLAWPEVTTADKFFYAPRLAPTMLAAVEAKKVPFQLLSEATKAGAAEEFLQQGLPPANLQTTPTTQGADLPNLARNALALGPQSAQWKSFEDAARDKGTPLRLAPFFPPGAVRVANEQIEIRFQMEDGLEWISYLACKAILRASAEIRTDFLGGSPSAAYRWTPGEEELCLWALEGTRENLRTQANMGRAPKTEPSLERLDEAARAGHVRGFVMVEFLLPRRGSLDGLSEAELNAAVEYTLSHALSRGSLASAPD